MSDTNETDRMNERRRNMGLPPITARASKPTRQLTTEDIREYLQEIKAIAEKLFPNEIDRDTYIKSARSKVKEELLAEKVQLTDDDQILILDKITGKVKTTKIDNVKSKPTSKDFFKDKSQDLSNTSPEVLKLIDLIKNDKTKSNRDRILDNVRAGKNVEKLETLSTSFESLLREQQTTIKLLNELKNKIVGSSATGGGIGGGGNNRNRGRGGVGSSILRGIVNNPGMAILGGIGVARAVGGIMSGSGTEPSPSPQAEEAIAGGAGGPRVQAQNPQGELNEELRSMVREGRLTREQANSISIRSLTGEITPEEAREEAHSLVQPANGTVPPPATPPANAPTSNNVPAVAETEEQIYNRLLAETPENMRGDVDVQNDLRSEAGLISRRNRQQASGTVPAPSPSAPSNNNVPASATIPTPASAPATVVSALTQDRSIPEGATPVRLNGQLVGYMPEGGGPTVTFDDAGRQELESARSEVRRNATPVTPPTSNAPDATPMPQPILTPTSTPDASGPEGNDVNGLGLRPAVAVPSSTSLTQDRSIPEGATPIRSNGRVIGYMPEGGGPTITFDDAGRQELESARSEVRRNATPVTQEPVVSTATASVPELTPTQSGMVNRLLRDKKLQDDGDAKELAESLVRQIRPSSQQNIDERILESNFTSRRIRQSPIGMLIAHQPVIPGQTLTPNQMVAVETGIMMNGRTHYPPVVLEQYERQKRENVPTATRESVTSAATPVTSTTNTLASAANATRVTQDRSIPEGATPVRLNGQLVGYMPEGGGPTITFNDVGRQELESARLRVVSETPPLAASEAPTVRQMGSARTRSIVMATNPVAAPQVQTTTPSVDAAIVPAEPAATPSSIRTLEASNISRREYFDQTDNNAAVASGFELADDTPAAELTDSNLISANALSNIADTQLVSLARDPVTPNALERNIAKDDDIVVNEAVREAELLAREYESNPDLFSNRNLVLRARKVTFSGDSIEFKLPAQSADARQITPSGGGESPIANLVAPPPPVSSSGGGSGSAPAEGSGSQQLATEQGSAAADTSGLSFAPGVDPRINKDIAQKFKQIEGAFGKSLTITSGFRDQQRNTRAGGARNSAHTRANAIDIQFRGNQEDTNKLIEVASAAGIGGIGVYRPGWLHLDTESKRVWGPDFTARSVPDWAKNTLQAHMSGQTRSAPSAQTPESPASGSDATPVASSESSAAGVVSGSEGGGSSDATPVSGSSNSGASELSSSSGSTSVAQPLETATSGSIVNSASVDNAMAERSPAPAAAPNVIDMSSGSSNPSTPPPAYNSSNPNDPGLVEPEDAAERYARLFDMAA